MSHAIRSREVSWVGFVTRFLTIGAACLPLLAHGEAARHPITHRDLWAMKRVAVPVPSPDGRWVVVAVTEPEDGERRQVSDLWLLSTDASAPPRRLTGSRGHESGVAWSPDSRRLVFASHRDGDDIGQLYLLSLAGGDAGRLTALVNGARSPEFSPDGRYIAFVSDVFRGAGDDAEDRRIAQERAQRKWNARIYDSFPTRSWDHWLDDRQPHLFVLELPATGHVPTAPRDLLAGTALVRANGFAGRDSDTSVDLDPAWAPDGRSIIFVASTDADQGARALTSVQLWRVALAGGEPVQLTGGRNLWSKPCFTPDGRWLLAAVERAGEFVYNKVQVAGLRWNAATLQQQPEVRWFTQDFDRSITTFAPAADSRTVYALAEDAGHEQLYRVPLDGAPVRLAFPLEHGAYANLAVAQAARKPVIVANWDSAVSPPEVVRIDADGASHALLSNFNAAALQALDLAPVREFWFTSAAGRRIHNLLVVPPGFDPTRKYPLFNVIHGGPHAMWRDQWSTRWNYHLLAAPGYVVLLTNYSGSTGFGEKFARVIQGDPLRSAGLELNEAVDAALQQFPFIDADRLCAGGGSYGGHLANWLQATTTRYRCLVSHAGLVNLESQWGTSDTVYSRELNNGGPVWEQGPIWREQNPIRYAARFRTPALITVGEKDFRVPMNNSIEYFTVLQRLSIPSRLIVFPEENHWVLQQGDSRLFYAEIAGWLARWLR
jgi:dipeptidyl aminopeptidase/acylaminoacyl peptidase